MTNLERLNLELSNKPYFSSAEYGIFLDENGLTATDNYDATEKKALLGAVLDVLNALSNDIDLFRKIETEFATQGAAFEALTVRIEQVKSRIAETSATDGSYTDQTINYLFYGG